MTKTIKVKITGDSKSAIYQVIEDIRRLYLPHVDTTAPKYSDGGGYHAFVTIYIEVSTP